MPERQYRIHPAIGIARVGDAVRSDASNDFYFIGPESPEVTANIDPQSGAQGRFKTPDGRIKPQAARFRIFEYEKGNDGKFRPIGEVTTSDNARAVKITWTVHLANRKANFCAFHGQAGAEDDPLFSSYGTPQNPRLNVRNVKVKTKDQREKTLELDGGLQRVNGGDAVTVAHFPIDHDLTKKKPSGETKLKIRTLGELRSDADGRLIVIGGMGQSDFDLGLGNEQITTFANNDGWFDDVSDGPVEAVLSIDGIGHEVVSAWALVAPPDFAPAVRSHRTMYDTLVDVIVRELTIPTDDGLFAGPLAHIAAMNEDWKRNGMIKDFKPSFTRDIAPLLVAIVGMERVHQHQMGPRARYHGSLTELNFAALGGQGSLQGVREAVFERLRDPNTFDSEPRPKLDPSRMPSSYGDYYGAANGRGGDSNDPAFLHSISKLQFALLNAWKNGNFVEDWTPTPANQPAITPEGLDRAALENMSGGAFYPGMEASWLFANKQVWKEPLRIASGKKIGTIPVPGEGIRDLIVEAGTFSQQMALPWQADFFECSAPPLTDTSGWVDDPSVAGKKRRVGWWPANRPDEIFRVDAPRDRCAWARVPDPQQPLGYREMRDDNEMVNLWSTLGFVVAVAPDGAPKDFYEVEFNPAPPAIMAVAEAAPKPAPVPKKAARARKKRRATASA
jgi:hypothetical protein